MLTVVAGAAGLVLQQPSVESQQAPTAEQANPFEEARRTGVRDLLDRWSAAVRAGDEPALAALFDPGAMPEFLPSEVRRMHALAAVPLADFGYEIGRGPETPVPTDLAEQLQATDVWAPQVYLRYAIAGADLGPTRKPVALVVARRGEQWKLVSDRPLPEYDRRTWRGPWDFGPVTVRTVQTDGGTSVVIGHPWQDERVDAVAADLVAAVPAVTEMWGPNWSRRAVVLVTAEQDEFAAQVGTEHSGADIAAVATSDAVAPDSGAVTGQRVVFSPTAGNRLTEGARRSVLRHELTHIATRAETLDGSPMWMLEGFADYVGHRGSGVDVHAVAPTVSAAVAMHGPPDRLPADADFAAGGERATVAYESAWTVAAFIADQFGEDRLRSLYRELAAGPVEAPVADERIERTLGIDSRELVGQWGSWLAARIS
ncbi:peptidase MA family metallohydrolase [Rhodococcus sp. NPDC058505]|uniref:peptidase MA family metallohydrolase n=1 Tax=Rhodococcus sp. NPDC058505 TaxID=3346531 RepID=UPI003660FF50